MASPWKNWHLICHYIRSPVNFADGETQLSSRTPSAPLPDSAPDGRVRRGELNREAILDAIYEIILEGNPRPTAEGVAERAGVGTRTVFRHFADMESLHAEMSERLQREMAPLLDAKPATGSFEQRISDLVHKRAALYERIAPFKRSANQQRHESLVIQRAHADMTRRSRQMLLEALPELERAPAPLLEALDLLASFEAWDRLRVDQRLGRERAEAVVEHALLALVRTL